MSSHKGSCLCGALTCSVEGPFDGARMCHRSNCRKARGGTGNTILVVDRRRIRWLTGEEHLTAGTLDDAIGVGIATHIFRGSRADWDYDMDGAGHFRERPPPGSSEEA